MSLLVLLRHGESDYNARRIYAGQVDCDLTDLGREQAREAGRLLQGLAFDVVFTSTLKRATETSDLALEAAGHKAVEAVRVEAFNERSYGDLTGEPFPEEQRGKDYLWQAPPNGESYMDLLARVETAFESYIHPYLQENKNILITSHGGTKRVLHVIMGLITPEDCLSFHVPNAEPMLFSYSRRPDGGFVFMNGVQEKEF